MTPLKDRSIFINDNDSSEIRFLHDNPNLLGTSDTPNKYLAKETNKKAGIVLKPCVKNKNENEFVNSNNIKQKKKVDFIKPKDSSGEDSSFEFDESFSDESWREDADKYDNYDDLHSMKSLRKGTESSGVQEEEAIKGISENNNRSPRKKNNK